MVVTDDAAGEVRRLLAGERCASLRRTWLIERGAQQYRDAVIDPVAAEPAADRAGPPAAATDLLRPTFRRELTPTWLSATALLAGHRPLDPDRPLRVLDLHGGAGVTAAVIAAAHPDAQVWVVDDRAGERRAGGSAGHQRGPVERDGPRSEFHRRRAAELRRHRRWSTTSSRQPTMSDGPSSRTIIRRRVRPGGLVVVGYRTRIGWSEVVPLRCLALLFARAGQPPADWQRRAIVDMLERLRGVQARPTSSTARPSRRSWSWPASMDCEELADVLLTEHLEPMAFADVAEWLAPAGGSPVGSALLGDLDVDADSPFGDLLDDTQDEPLREAFRDLVTPADVSHRRVPSRDAHSRPPRWTRAMLMDLELVALSGARPSSWTMTCWRLPSNASAMDRRPWVTSSRQGPVGPAPRRSPRARVARTRAWRTRVPPAGAPQTAATACCALNRCLADPELTPAASVLASPVIGSAIPVSSADPGDPATGALLARLGIGGHA